MKQDCLFNLQLNLFFLVQTFQIFLHLYLQEVWKQRADPAVHLVGEELGHDEVQPGARDVVPQGAIEGGVGQGQEEDGRGRGTVVTGDVAVIEDPRVPEVEEGGEDERLQVLQLLLTWNLLI